MASAEIMAEVSFSIIDMCKVLREKRHRLIYLWYNFIITTKLENIKCTNG